MKQRFFLTAVSVLVLSAWLGGYGKASAVSLTDTSGTGSTGGFTLNETNGAASAGTTNTVGLTDGDTSESTSNEVKVLLPDGSLYVGEMRDGKVNGRGTVVSPDGTNQRGEWHDGRPYRVSGRWVSADGTREVGTWNTDGTRSGGKITWKDGRKYEGDWRVVPDGSELPNGTGKMIWPDGRTFVGQFYNGQPDGTGKMTYPDGKVEDGLWKLGTFAGATH